MIEFVGFACLFYKGTDFTGGEWYYMDGFIVIPLLLTMGWTKAYPYLNEYLPSGDLLGLPEFSSIIGVIFIQVVG